MNTLGLRRRALVASTVLALSTAGLLTAGPAAAQEDSWVGDVTRDGITLVGGDYWWEVQFWQPQPASLSFFWDDDGHLVPVPAEWQPDAVPVEVTFVWGDGATDTYRSDTTDPDQMSVACDTSTYVDDNGNVQPGENFGYGCRSGAGHVYTRQGIYPLQVHVSQGPDAASSPVRDELVIDLRLGGTLSGRGTVQARSAGMYDQNFPQPGDNTTTTFKVTAKRRAGTAATTATVDVSVPGMHPEFSGATGMTFHGTAALVPMYVSKTRAAGEIILSRVEGRVTNSVGYAGGAQAQIHVRVQKGARSLIRIQIWNTSAGFSYLDTGYQDAAFYLIDPTTDRLLSGWLRVG